MPVKLYQGDTWTRAWVLQDAAGQPIDLTGAQARLQVRTAADALALSASTADGRLTLTPLEGRIDLAVPFADMSLAVASYAYALEVTHANGVRRTYEADVLSILEDVTHD